MGGFSELSLTPPRKLFYRPAQAQFCDSVFHKRTTFIRFHFVWGLKAGIQQVAWDHRAALTGALSQLQWRRNLAVFSGETSGEQAGRETMSSPSEFLCAFQCCPHCPGGLLQTQKPDCFIMKHRTGWFLLWVFFFFFHLNQMETSILWTCFFPLYCCPDRQEEEMAKVGLRKEENRRQKHKVYEERDFQFHRKATALRGGSLKCQCQRQAWASQPFLSLSRAHCAPATSCCLASTKTRVMLGFSSPRTSSLSSAYGTLRLLLQHVSLVTPSQRLN